MSSAVSQRRGRPSRSLRFHFEPKPPRQRLLAWYLERRRELPWRVLWRQHGDPYHVWVSEIMLQQTVIKAVLPVYDRFLKQFPTVQHLANASEEDVRKAVRGLGYYRRFRMLHEASKVLCKQSSAKKINWPQDYDSWKELPGIGDYTASAISSIAFDYPAAVVDGNVERVFCRLLDLREPPNTPELKKAFKVLAQELLDTQSPGDFNQAVMELGQTICTPTSPACGMCPLEPHCLAAKRGSQALAPAPKTKAAFEEVRLRLTIVKTAAKGGNARYALLERPATAKFLKETRGFYTEMYQDKRRSLDSNDSNDSNDSKVVDKAALKSTTGDLEIVGSIKHNITKHNIIAEVAVLTVPNQKALPLSKAATWYEAAAVEEHLLANLDRKAWKVFQVAHKKS